MDQPQESGATRFLITALENKRENINLFILVCSINVLSELYVYAPWKCMLACQCVLFVCDCVTETRLRAHTKAHKRMMEALTKKNLLTLCKTMSKGPCSERGLFGSIATKVIPLFLHSTQPSARVKIFIRHHLLNTNLKSNQSIHQEEMAN